MRYNNSTLTAVLFSSNIVQNARGSPETKRTRKHFAGAEKHLRTERTPTVAAAGQSEQRNSPRVSGAGARQQLCDRKFVPDRKNLLEEYMEGKMTGKRRLYAFVLPAASRKAVRKERLIMFFPVRTFCRTSSLVRGSCIRDNPNLFCLQTGHNTNTLQRNLYFRSKNTVENLMNRAQSQPVRIGWLYRTKYPKSLSVYSRTHHTAL